MADKSGPKYKQEIQQVRNILSKSLRLFFVEIQARFLVQEITQVQMQ